MFGDATFAEATFADFFTGLPNISWTFRKGRTVVIAITPSDGGSIVTGIIPRYLRTSVEAILPESGSIVSYLDNRIIRTNVTAIKGRDS